MVEKSLEEVIEQCIPGFKSYLQARIDNEKDLLWQENQALEQLLWLVPINPAAALQIAMLLGKWTVLH